MIAVLKNYRLNCQDNVDWYCIADFDFLYKEVKMFLFCIPEQKHSLAALRVMLSLIQLGYAISVFQTVYKSLPEDKNQL